MNVENLIESDELARLIFSPKDYLDGGLGALDMSGCFCFSKKSNHRESVNCRRLSNNYPADFHRQGDAQLDERNKICYMGFCLILVENLQSIKCGRYYFIAVHSPLQDNIAHCDIRLENEKNEKLKPERRLAIKKLADAFSDPIKPN